MLFGPWKEAISSTVLRFSLFKPVDVPVTIPKVKGLGDQGEAVLNAVSLKPQIPTVPNKMNAKISQEVRDIINLLDGFKKEFEKQQQRIEACPPKASTSTYRI